MKEVKAKEAQIAGMKALDIAFWVPKQFAALIALSSGWARHLGLPLRPDVKARIEAREKLVVERRAQGASWQEIAAEAVEKELLSETDLLIAELFFPGYYIGPEAVGAAIKWATAATRLARAGRIAAAPFEAMGKAEAITGRAIAYPIKEAAKAGVKAAKKIPTKVPRVMDLPTNKEVLEIALKPTTARVLGKHFTGPQGLPGLKSILSKVNLSLVADNPFEVARVLRGVYQELEPGRLNLRINWAGLL
jgi:hypothetical protein